MSLSGTGAMSFLENKLAVLLVVRVWRVKEPRGLMFGWSERGKEDIEGCRPSQDKIDS